MNADEASLSCVVNLEWYSKQGLIERKFSQKKADLHLVRNERRTIFIEIRSEKMVPIKLLLKNINVYKKFMSEGKSSIKFEIENCTLYLSNAPPGKLLTFLKTIFIKMSEDRQNSTTPLRNQILSGKLNYYENISPVSNSQFGKVLASIQNPSDSIITSFVSKKRKMETNSLVKVPAAKRLYNTTLNEIDDVSLNQEQIEVLDACRSGKNIFFTGSAGTGKSFLLKKLICALPPDVTIATASTGI